MTRIFKLRNALLLFAVTRAISAISASGGSPTRSRLKEEPTQHRRWRDKIGSRAKSKRAMKESDEGSLVQMLQEMGSLGWKIICKVRNEFENRSEGTSRDIEDLAKNTSAKFKDIVASSVKN